MSDPILALPALRDTIASAGLEAARALGQNFLLDLNLTRALVKLAPTLEGLDLIEIGPGPGGLTRALLLGGARHVDAFDIDARALEALAPLEAAAQGRLHLHLADALGMAPEAYGTDGTRAIAANLPYNIATPLLIKWLRWIAGAGPDRSVRFMLLMFQKEVAERLCATPGDKTYGRLSVMTQHVCTARLVKILSPEAFTPAPKVHSAVVLLTPRENRPPCAFDTLETIVAQAFGQRRKMLRQSLKPYTTLFEAAGITPTDRAEQLPVSTFEALARLVKP